MTSTIMLVEDDLDISNIIKMVLTISGFKVIVAANGAEGLDLASKHHIDIVITDLMMPVMDGNQFIKELSKTSKPPPVIVYTAVEKDVEPNPLIKVICSKPLSPKLLVEAVKILADQRGCQRVYEQMRHVAEQDILQ